MHYLLQKIVWVFQNGVSTAHVKLMQGDDVLQSHGASDLDAMIC